MLPKYSLTGTYYAEGKTRYDGTVPEGIWCENDVVLTSMRRDYGIFCEGGGKEQGNWPFTLWEHWKITHYF